MSKDNEKVKNEGSDEKAAKDSGEIKKEPKKEPESEKDAKGKKTSDSKEVKKKTAKKESKTEKLQKELDSTKEQLLRVTAEYANYRKRTEKEKSDAYAFAKAETVKEILPSIDNLERALANEGGSLDDLKKGVEMTHSAFINALKKIGVESFGEVGETFDPNLHNAVMQVEDEKYKSGEIVNVFQKGYKIGDKIIRAAMVQTAK